MYKLKNIKNASAATEIEIALQAENNDLDVLSALLEKLEEQQNEISFFDPNILFIL